MGNIISGNNETNLDFGNIKTDNISSTIPYLKKLNTDAKNLVNNLNVSDDSLVFTETENFDMYKIFEKSKGVENKKVDNNTFSDTSPFISSEKYNSLMKKQLGGGEKDDDSSSTTSSSKKKTENDSELSGMTKSEELEEVVDEMNDSMDLSDEMKDTDDEEEKEKEKSEISEMSAGSYVSSSAHTDEINSDSMKLTTITVGNEKYLSDSINTSDINMISVED